MALIVYIGFAQPDEWTGWAGTYARHAQRFEEAAGGTYCLVVPFSRVTPEFMVRLAPQAVIMSGFARSFDQYDIREFIGVTQWVRSTHTPTLALCGSHQLLGYLFNGTLDTSASVCDEPMRHLRPGEPVTNPDYHPEYFMERGFYQVQLTNTGVDDPLFTGLGRSPYLYESHYCEIKVLPAAFRLLASTPECRIQAMRHDDLSMYGVQFHPEDYSDRFPAGKRLLENFFLLSRTLTATD